MWIMTTQKVELGFDVLIGNLRIAKIQFVPGGSGKVWLHTQGPPTDHVTMSTALKFMHSQLNAPAEEFQS